MAMTRVPTTTTTMINAGADVCGAIRFKFKLFKYINNNVVMIILILILSLLTNTSSATTTASNSNSNTVNYTFAIIPKSINNIFFDDVIKGCDYRSNELLLSTTATATTAITTAVTNVTCLFMGPVTQNAMEQVAVIDELIFKNNHNNQKIDGIAVSVIDSNAIKEVLLKAKSYGIQVITFDSDIEIDSDDDIDDASTTTTTTTTNSSSSSLKIKYRSAYVGTDNIAFGEQIGKTLIELAANTANAKAIANAGGEDGGDVRIHKFGIISNTDPNILLREQGLRNVLSKNSNNSNSNNNTWIEVHQSPMDMKDNKYLALGQMHILTVENSLTAIVSLLGGPMFDTTTDRGWEAFATTHDNPNLLLVSADSLPIQVELLHKGYANGLVGQLPFDMGMKSFDTLLNLVTTSSTQKNVTVVPEIIHTDLIEFVLLSSSSSDDGDGDSGGDSAIAPPSIIEDGSNNNTMDDIDIDIDIDSSNDNDNDHDIKTSYVFAIVSKSINIPFFDDVKAGCEARAATIMRRTSNQVNIECFYTGPIEQDDPIEQAKIIEDLILNNNGNGNNNNDTVKVDGIAFSVIDSNIAYNLTVMAQDANIPIITFDSDAPFSKRIAYIGTDNRQLGNELANTLLLVVKEEENGNGNENEPQNGDGKKERQKSYGVVSNNHPNLQLREKGLNDILSSSSSSAKSSMLWNQVDNSPTNFEQINDLIVNNTSTNTRIDAIFSTAGRPMRDVEEWKDFVSNNINTNNNKIKLIVADTHPDQVKLLQQKYVNGLVGQTPYLMGSISIDVLLKLATKKAKTATATTTTTLLDNSSGSGSGNDNDNTDIDIEEYLYTNLVRARLIESKNQNDNIDDSDGNGDDDGDGNDDSSNASSLLPSFVIVVAG
ncbi:periplasmic binding protein-like I [Fragilariopsis cylindrus CCMP1102]|uniref:Periplasmic binding protein-like I n=1 Tax=Fragilariopsis cylindrus CCMP1102 TaxID=635003 RepID=A0A1E7F828_9STRA|nr:periplasmic binding protein-like I [Fragilariopsis cylindrus CCMP1102]|eukprot:OEU14289.1 periplasmic binding protein-like I [Fragilariopsis cylindrus CCMP1102]